jgi:hypothetical protein
MKPLNLDNSPCSPISSNCVIWQGPDIPCIKLCNGDTVSDVIHKLATELCIIMETLKVSNYDLSCFDLAACPPSTFEELIQFLINKICELNLKVDAVTGVNIVTTGTTRSTTADTLITVAPCFIVGTTTVMTISEYAIAMGTAICGIVNQITAIINSITNLDVRVTVLENTPTPPFTMPSISVSCDLSASVVSPGTYTITDVLDALVNDSTYGYCALTSTTGLPADILAAVQSQCIDDTDTSLVYNTPFSIAYLGLWVPIASTNTVADAITNIWIALCDVYNYVSSLSVTGDTSNTIAVTVSPGPAYVVSANLLDTGWIDLEGFGYYTGVETNNLKPKARRIGNTVHFKGLITIPIDNGAGAPLLWQYESAPPVDTYYLSNTITPATGGAGSVLLSTAGSLTFNQGTSVIPTTIMGLGETFDDNYAMTFVVGTRPCQVDAAPVTSTILSGLFNISISSSKLLTLSLPKNAEQNSFSGTAAFDTSHLNYIISHVTAGDNVPSFSSANTNVNSNPAAGTIGLDLEYSAANIYPFSCNANSEQQVGGFRIQLDGLTAYIDPCTTDIPIAIICP